LKTEAKDLVPDGENRYKFSLFGGVSDFNPKENNKLFFIKLLK